MSMFLLAAAVLLLVAVAPVAYPLIRGRESRPEDPDGEVVGLGRERLEELRQRRRSGEMGEEEYAERVSDLEAQLSDDLHAQGASNAIRARSGGRWIGIAAVVFVPVLSGLLYLAIGQPGAVTSDTRSGTPRSTVGGDMSPSDIDAMVSGLADRLEENPDDPEGWFMLGRSYMVLNRYEAAAGAFSRLRALVGDEPDVLVREATAIALHNGGSLGGEPAGLIQRALEAQPDHPQALWLAATAAYQAQRYETALDYFQRVRPMVAGEQRQQVDGMLRDLAEKGYGQPVAEGSDPAADSDAGASLTVNVALAPSMQSKVNGDETVFVFAKAVNGPPMPLAVVRKTLSDLPVTVTLNDNQAMTPQFKLSEFERVTVGARVSSSGQPTARPGDLEGVSPPLPTDTSETVEVIINRVVPDNGQP